jgi:LemA protein
MEEAWAGIDAQLKRRADLIPNLVEVIKGYARHEEELLGAIAETRSQSLKAESLSEKGLNENNLTRNLKNLLVVCEAYPNLLANQNFLDLQKNLSEIENNLQMARRYYNGTVRNYNILVDSFPSLILARLFCFKKGEFFKLELVTKTEAPEVDFL